MSTAWTLSEYRYKKTRSRVEENLAGLKLFALQQVTNPTSADFLGACTSSNSREVDLKWRFNVAVRLYLGLPVTSRECRIENCNGKQMVPNGDHSGHVKCQINERHTGMKNCVAKILKPLEMASEGNWQVRVEQRMDDHFALKAGAKVDNNKGEICDVLVWDRASGHVMALDIVVGHPIMGKHGPGDRVKEAAKSKYEVYSKWEMDPKDVIPIAFSTYFEIHPDTLEFLRRMASSYGGTKKAGTLLRQMRNKLAIELVRGQTQLISELNRRNIGAKGRW